MNAFSRRFVQGKPIDFTLASEFKVDSDVPLPVSGHATGQLTELRKALAKLKVGQSLTVPWDQATGRAKIRPGNATRLIKNKEYTQRTVVENNIKLVRIWRIK